MATIPASKTAGEELAATEVNKLRDIGYVVDLDAGETINGATLPVAIYIDDTDNEVKACDGNDQAKLEFIGFAISNSTDGNAIQIQNNGIVAGFTGLDIGKKYYVQDDKTIGTAVGTYETIVGIAISATQILIVEPPGMQYCGSATDTADTITVPAIARHAVVNISAGSAYQNTQANFFLSRKGCTAATSNYRENALGAGSCSGTATWADTVINLTYGGNATAISGTAYFYR